MKKALQISSLIALNLFIICMCMFIFAMINESTTEAAPQNDIQDLMKQVSVLSTKIDRINFQIQDLYFMTEPLRIQITSKQGGKFYYSRVYTHKDKDWWGMLPSELPKADLQTLLNSASDLGYNKEKIKELSDKYVNMLKTPHFTPYDPEYTAHKSELTYRPDINMYFITNPFEKRFGKIKEPK